MWLIDRNTASHQLRGYQSVNPITLPQLDCVDILFMMYNMAESAEYFLHPACNDLILMEQAQYYLHTYFEIRIFQTQGASLYLL
mmetsp:Transcript_29125/g.33543  ORF Transcript_29125/g.33543 Transcript_29125/m.33543 type:complete len:84 (+) Transcript_29125:171-422(+)